MYGISRRKSWWGAETTRTRGNMLPDWTFVDRSALVHHLTKETQRLHPDRCARPVHWVPGKPVWHIAMSRLYQSPTSPMPFRLRAACVLLASHSC